MSDNDLEDQEVSFLPGKDHTGKGSFYNPSIKHKCRQLVCSVRAAIIITVCAAIFILAIAFIAAFARQEPTCSCANPTEIPPVKVTPTEAKTPSGEPFPYQSIRLPKSVIPELYDIFMHPNLTLFTFKGSINITVKVLESTNRIVLHSDHLKLSNQWFKCAERHVEIVKFLEYEPHSQLYVEFAEKLKAGSVCMLHIEFSANLSDALHGFYKSSYVDPDGNRRYLATTHFEATHARSAFPCFDEPEMKANFTMSIVHEDKYIALFNMPVNTHEPYSPGLFIDIFDTSVKMSTYLVAFVVCDYKNVTGYTKIRNTRVSVYAPPHQIQEAVFAQDAAVKILDYYEDFFGVPYPLPKQDLIAIPDFSAGAMENWGLITYRMTSILYNPEVSSSGNKQWVAVVVAHELAHQWFGNLVTMKWWNDLWLNEGFASFTEYIGADQVQKDWQLMDQFVVETLQAALGSDSLQNSHPISVPVHDPAEINEIFDSISYDKGSSLIRMIEGFVGREVLRKGLKRYLTKFQFKNAQTDDLWQALSVEANMTSHPVNVKSVMDTWTLQMGYPVVNLTWNRQTNVVTASQQRFLLFPNSAPSTEFKTDFGYKWHIPLSYRTDQSAAENLTWMPMKSVTFKAPGATRWLKANVNMKGFYRVLYDDQNWQALTLELKRNISVLPAADRASLLDDAFSLARAGMLKLKVALDLSEYLFKEDQYIPWSVGLGNLHYIGKLLQGKPEHEYYKKYSLYLMQNVIKSVGWTDEGGQLKKYLRALVLGGASRLGDKASINKINEIFNDWMNNSNKTVPVNLKVVVYGGGVQHGGEKAWDFTWKKYKEAKVPSEKKKLLIALARSDNADVINRYLHWSLDDKKVRSQDSVSVITRLASNGAAGRILAWHFIRANWGELYKRYGETAFAMKSLINGVVTGFTNEFDRTEVERFFKGVPLGSGKRAVHQALEAIQMNIDWLKQYQDQVTSWLSAKVKELRL